MERVEVINHYYGIAAMRVCAVKDATDEEILKVCNSENPSGTTNGWSHVQIDTSKDIPGATAAPIECIEDSGRLHILVFC